MRTSYSINKPRTNNEAEYEALIVGLQITLSMDIKMLQVFSDSILVIKQIQGEFEVRKPQLTPYYQKAMRLMAKFYHIELKHVGRGHNAQANALAKLASSLAVPPDKTLNITVMNWRQILSMLEICSKEDEVAAIDISQASDWRQHLL